LKQVSFHVPTGKTTAVIGPNGAGKSVLLKAILGLLPVKQGEVEFFGVDYRNFRLIAKKVSYIPQTLRFDVNLPLTVTGLFSFKSSRPLGFRREEKERMGRLLRQVGMEKFADYKLSSLSGGQLQRLLLAHSLMNEPELLILDEPSAGIDVKGQETIYALLERIQKEHNLTMLMVSHELEVVMRYASQVVCLNRELVCVGPPQEALTNETLEEMYGGPVSHYTHAGHQHS